MIEIETEDSRIKRLIKEAICEAVGAASAASHRLIPLVESVKTAKFIAENLPLGQAKQHGALRNDAVQNAPPGVCMEFGVWQGFWISTLARAFPCKRFIGFDSFEGLPEDWSTRKKGHFDLGGELPSVPSNVDLVKGWFSESLPMWLAANPTEKVSFIHMDCDLYSSTMQVLSLLRPRLQVGTAIVLDDYMQEPGWQLAEHGAFHDFCRGFGISFRYTGYSAEAPTVSASVVLTNV